MVDCCSIEIFTRIADRESVFRTNGKYERRRNRFTVSYKQNTDSVRLIADDTEFFMTRKGEVELNMVFRKSSFTRATLTAVGGEGGFAIFTKRYEKSEIDGDLHIVLEYELRFPQDSEKYHLEIFVKTDSEEK